MPLGCEDMMGSNNKRWFGSRSNQNDPYDPTKGYLSPYLGAQQSVTACPSRYPFQSADWNNSFEKGCAAMATIITFFWAAASASGYGLLASCSKRGEFSRPARTAALRHRLLSSGRIIEYSLIELPSWCFSEPMTARLLCYASRPGDPFQAQRQQQHAFG